VLSLVVRATVRQRFNVLGDWNAVTRKLVAVTNNTVVNTETTCELLGKIASMGLAGPITLVLGNARFQRNAAVMALAEIPAKHAHDLASLMTLNFPQFENVSLIVA
jgi:hypothetical protein